MTENKRYAVAIDIGTTTVALYLLDTKIKKTVSVINELNAQVPYGADVSSRIRYCQTHGHEMLTQIIREQIQKMIDKACSIAGVNQMNIEYISIAGNTIMQHFAADYSPVGMGASPFPPISLFGMETSAWDTLKVFENARIYYTPAVSAYVGGDVTAGLLSAGFEELSAPSLFIDIGTNGEIVLKHKGVYYCCATAAGPAFEGAEIEMGMAAIDGAIDHVWLNNGDIDFSVIGGGKPHGFCGSGLLDLLAVMLDTGAVDKTGRLLGMDKFYITSDFAKVYVTAEDIRKLQLAKAAIAAGIDVLLHFAKIGENDIKLLALAGGFGSYMDLKNAARVGLIPKNLLSVAKTCGNTAGEGAIMTLTHKDVFARLENIRKRCEYVELSSIAFFNDRFVEQMSF